MSSSALVDASRPRSGILTPSSEGSLNRRGASISPDGRTRKRQDAVAMDHLLKPSISVKPHPSNLQSQPRVLSPLMLLPRQHLSLGCLDFAAPDTELPQSRLVESHIKVLDLECRLGSALSVLIARNDSRGTVYALERQDKGLYVLCKLGSWVNLAQLAQHATALSSDRLAPPKLEPREPDSRAAVTTPQLHKDQKKKRAAIEAIQSLVRKKVKSQSTSQVDGSSLPAPDEPNLGTQARKVSSPDIKADELSTINAIPKIQPAPLANAGEDEPPVPVQQQTAETIFDAIRVHYSEALYKSMGSLAYFAKGPLSRARSAFHLDLESNLEMANLTDFLKSLVLSTVQIDKKYRESIPDVISRMKTQVDSSDEGGKKRRKPKKMKLGKDSLYPLEDENVRTWWNANKPDPDGEEVGVSASQIKSHVSILRTRETQLQMILILEILALEPLKAVDDAGESNLPTLPGAAESQAKDRDQMMAPPLPKKRNKHNLPVLVDVHADRLTIWQSTASDEQLLLGDSQATQISIDGQFQQKSSSEPLKDFCVDVIVPFFSARLPELCDTINRKLGGPVISPAKSKSLKRSSNKREQKPGAATKRPAPPSARRTLQRALSTDHLHRRSVSRGPSNAIALMRSATSTSLSGAKREGSEPLSLRDLPKGEALASRQRQTSLSRSSSMVSLDDMKANRKAMVEAELKDAISALRKPNREVVVSKAMAEADERRAITSLSSRKVKKVSRSTLASSIQVKATPANNRFIDVLAVKPELGADTPLLSTEDVIPPSSIGFLVPSTGHRHSHRDALADSVSPAMDLVSGTPARPSTQAGFIKRMPHNEPAIPPSSPLMDRRTCAVNDFAVSGVTTGARTDQRSDDIMATPVKRSISKLDLIQAPVSNQPKGMSIYEKLGWDDDFDDI